MITKKSDIMGCLTVRTTSQDLPWQANQPAGAFIFLNEVLILGEWPQRAEQAVFPSCLQQRGLSWLLEREPRGWRAKTPRGIQEKITFWWWSQEITLSFRLHLLTYIRVSQSLSVASSYNTKGSFKFPYNTHTLCNGHGYWQKSQTFLFNKT